MDGKIFGVTSAVTLVTTIAFVTSALRRRRPVPTCPISQWSRAIASAMCFTGSLLAIPAIGDRVEATIGIDNIARLGAHLCGIAFCAGLRVLLASWTYPRPDLAPTAWLRIRVALLIAAVATVLFDLTNSPAIEFSSSRADNLGVVAYLTTIYAYGLWVGAAIAYECAGMAMHNLRTGNTIIAAGQAVFAGGGVCCLIYTGTEMCYLLAYQVDRAWPLSTEQAIASCFSGLFMLFAFLGLGLSSSQFRSLLWPAARR